MLTWIINNITKSNTLKIFPEPTSYDDYSIALIQNLKDLKFIKESYENFYGKRFPLFNCFLYKLLGKKLVIVANDKRGNIVGFDMLYFNKRDILENTIHEGFIFVKPEFQGKGVSKNLRLYSGEYLRMNSISGLSTRIRESNKSSLYSALNIGFEKVECYKVSNSNCTEYYLVNRFL